MVDINFSEVEIHQVLSFSEKEIFQVRNSVLKRGSANGRLKIRWRRSFESGRFNQSLKSSEIRGSESVFFFKFYITRITFSSFNVMKGRKDFSCIS